MGGNEAALARSLGTPEESARGILAGEEIRAIGAINRRKQWILASSQGEAQQDIAEADAHPARRLMAGRARPAIGAE
jgi:hypothetical protein